MKKEKENLLIVEAHSDDSVISVGGFLEKYRSKYNYHFLLMAVSDVNLHHAGHITREQRFKEYENLLIRNTRKLFSRKSE